MDEGEGWRAGVGGHKCPPAGRRGAIASREREKERERNGVKKERNGVNEDNEKMAIIKMALIIRMDAAQAESGGR